MGEGCGGWKNDGEKCGEDGVVTTGRGDDVRSSTWRQKDIHTPTSLEYNNYDVYVYTGVNAAFMEHRRHKCVYLCQTLTEVHPQPLLSGIYHYI